MTRKIKLLMIADFSLLILSFVLWGWAGAVCYWVMAKVAAMIWFYSTHRR
jgi:hypothetical protein